jgi:hypothetical protein
MDEADDVGVDEVWNKDEAGEIDGAVPPLEELLEGDEMDEADDVGADDVGVDEVCHKDEAGEIDGATVGVGAERL